MRDAVAAWQAQNLQPGDVFSFASGGETWWGGVRLFPLGERAFRIAVLAPESDFLAGIVQQRNVVIAITAGALVAAFFIAMALARRYSRPLAALAADAERIQQLDIAGGETRSIDFLVPGILTLSIIATSMVSFAISTGYDRQYGALQFPDYV